jgi:polysaccharide pyruvyl transferase WcaK-like protein
MSRTKLNSRQPRRIGILGYYGANNLGDETVVAILIKRIREYYPNAELVGFSLNPANTARRHAIKAYSLRLQNEASFVHRTPSNSTADVKPTFVTKLTQFLKKRPMVFKPLKILKNCLCDLPSAFLSELAFLRRSFQRLQGFDLLVVPGSGPLTDWWGGPWTHPYTLLSWTLLAKVIGIKVIALSIGSERLTTRLGKIFCKWALSMATYRSFRDRYSRDTMEALGLKGENPVFPDQGFALLDLVGIKPRNNAITGSGEPNSGLIVGVCPVGKACCVKPGGDETCYERYRENLAALLLWLIRSGYRIAFCQTHEYFDRSLVEQLIDTIKAEWPGEDATRRIIQDPTKTTTALIASIRRCDIMIASRYHAVVLPYVLQKPVLAISYERKIGDLMAELGQADYHLSMDEANLGEMIRLFRRLELKRHSIAQHLGAVVADYSSRLTKQYETVFGTLKQNPPTLGGIPESGLRELPHVPVRALERVDDVDCGTSRSEIGVIHAR